MENSLDLRNVTKCYNGIPAVEDVAFCARRGEVTGYLGLNGSGKSTTMKMITLLIEKTSGDILLDDDSIERDPITFKRRMGYVPEEPHLYAHLTALEYLVMVSQLCGLPERRTSERIDGFLRCFSLHADRHLPLSSCSNGMRQKVTVLKRKQPRAPVTALDRIFWATLRRF